MKILLVSATKMEVAPFLNKLKKKKEADNFWIGRRGRDQIDVLITGVGMTNMAFHLGQRLHKKYDLVINAGVAGSFRKELPPGKVVQVVRDVFSDLGAEDGNRFLTLKEMGFSSVDRREAGIRKLEKWMILNIPRVHGITVNTVHGNEVSIKKVMKKFNPDVESMEGAAFFMACDFLKVRCVQIRAISNYVERRNKKKWKVGLAVENLNYWLGVAVTPF